MSVKLMSAIFETEFRDLQDEDGNNTKASTAKLVLLALADHANDEGEGAYPGLTKMELKTGLSRQTVINTYDALKYNGIIYLKGVSKLGTNNYTINTDSFPKLLKDASQAALLVKPLDPPSQATLPEVVKPLDPNHTLTINEPNKQQEEEEAVQNENFAIYEKEIGIITPFIADSILSWEKEDMPSGWIVDAIREAVKNNARKWAYVEAILKRWVAQGSKEPTKKSRQDKPVQPKGFDVIEGWLDRTQETVNG